MILSDATIKTAMEKGLIQIDPFQEKHLNSNSYDLTLNKQGWGEVEATGDLYDFITGKPIINPLDKETYNTENFVTQTFDLERGGFVIATVNERTMAGNGIVMQLGGKSSLARLGLAVHVTAGFGDAGWNGYYVMELVNLGPATLRLTAGMPIAQVIFEHADLSELTYPERKKSKYQDQKPGQGSLYYNNKELM